MPKRLTIEDFHVTLTISEKVSDPQASVIRRVLSSRKFRTAFKSTVQSLLGSYPELHRVRVTVTV